MKMIKDEILHLIRNRKQQERIYREENGSRDIPRKRIGIPEETGRSEMEMANFALGDFVL